MITKISDPVIDTLIGRMVAEAVEMTGGPLETFHERYSIEKARLLKSVIAPTIKQIAERLAHDEDMIQVNPNLRIHQPRQNTSVPFHSDTLYGHSHEEINYWLALTKAGGTNSLWMVPDNGTAQLHEALKSGMPLEEFDKLALSKAAPIETETPGLFTFCCSQIHGSVFNTTTATRVSADFRILPSGARANVKRNGYFRPKWLPELACPLEQGTVATTVASLDLAVPVHMQRLHMQKFYAQHGQRELVEFHSLDHSPTLDQARQKGPTVAYSILQAKKPIQIVHPIGFADENVWFTPQTQWAFDKLWSLQRRV